MRRRDRMNHGDKEDPGVTEHNDSLRRITNEGLIMDALAKILWQTTTYDLCTRDETQRICAELRRRVKRSTSDQESDGFSI